MAVAAAIAGCGARSELPFQREVQAIALGSDHSCARLSDGTVACWGLDASGQLGDSGPGPSKSTPVEVAAPVDVAFLACGGAGTCAVRDDGTLVCWGEVPGTVYGGPPVEVGSGYGAVSLGYGYSCAVLLGGTVACWGENHGGQLGNPSAPSTLQPAPGVTVVGLEDAVAVSAGSYFTCALRAGGSVVCWGEEPLGDGAEIALDEAGWPASRVVVATPVEVKGLPGPATQIAVGSMHACALIEDGTVACWGRRQGALGLDPATFTGSTGLAAELVAGLPKATMLSSGDDQTCAVLEDATVQCWGTNQLPYQGSSTPQLVAGLRPAVAVASGGFHDCALLLSGEVACWGGNDQGQLGDGTMTGSDLPVTVLGLP